MNKMDTIIPALSFCTRLLGGSNKVRNLKMIGLFVESTWGPSWGFLAMSTGTGVREALLPAGGAVGAASASHKLSRCYQYGNATPEHLVSMLRIPPTPTFLRLLSWNPYFKKWERQGMGSRRQNKTRAKPLMCPVVHGQAYSRDSRDRGLHALFCAKPSVYEFQPIPWDFCPLFAWAPLSMGWAWGFKNGEWVCFSDYISLYSRGPDKCPTEC